jgi:hypothetical protein
MKALTLHHWRAIYSAISSVTIYATLTFAPINAQAGRSCEDKPLEVHEISQGMNLAAKTAQALDRSGAQVVLLARMGQDLSKYNVRYSHMGFAYRDTDGRWRVVHKLNQCGTANAAVYRQGLGEFFLDRPYRYEAAFVIPTSALQQQLAGLLNNNAQVARLHEERYNMLAYPWSVSYQQSNQWVIETLGMASAGASNRHQAQSWLKQQNYQATTLYLNAMTRLGANVTRANIAFDDHPTDKRFSGRIETVTVDSVFTWLQNVGLTGPVSKVQ